MEDLVVLKKILRNVDTPEVNISFAEYLQSICSYLSGEVTDSLRDGAISLEKQDLNKSLMLMEVAHTLRPKGNIIMRKINKYKELLNNRQGE